MTGSTRPLWINSSGAAVAATQRLCDRNGGDERSEKARARSTGEGIVDAGALEVRPEALDQVLRRLGEQERERPSRTVELFLGPEVEQSGRVDDVPNAFAVRCPPSQ